MKQDIDYVLAKLDWMEAERIWPNGLRYLWTDAFGVLLYLSLYRETEESRWIDKAEWLVRDVERVLGRTKGLRIGEAPDRDGQYFHYLSMWLTALARFGEFDPAYRVKGIGIAHDIHQAFVVPGVGVIWKMREDLSAPYPGYGFGALDAFDGYVAYRLLGDDELAVEIDDMKALIEQQYRTLDVDQDLGLGMMLWLAHFFPAEDWARHQTLRSLEALDQLWNDPPGFFSRASYARNVRIAFANYGVSIGLQAADVWPDRVERLNAYFDHYRSGDEYDREAITHVMACSSHLPGLLISEGSSAEAT